VRRPIRGGKIIRSVDYFSQQEALEAVGLALVTMSQANVEIVRRFLWAFENDTDVFRGTLHPQIEWFPIEENQRRLYGVEAAMRNRNEWLDTWDEHGFDLEEVIEEGDSVVALVHITARGKTSGIETDVRFYAHFKMRDHQIVYVFDHGDRAAALDAAGPG
jgi:ketosteroid isomerase-like protein